MADPDRQYFEVEQIVRNYISRMDEFQVSEAAIRFLLEPGLAFNFEGRNIDPRLVEKSLDEIFLALRPGQIGSADIRIAMKQARCHYLWFC